MQPREYKAFSRARWQCCPAHCNVEGFAPVPRIQIVTIEEALELRDRAVRLPARRDDTFRRAAREEDRGARGSLDL
jgi:site-specific DNA-methyltransferase (adenine-specific)